MTTVVNTPSGGNDSGGAGVVIGAVLVLLVLVVVVLLSMPYLRQQVEGMKPENPVINVTLPAPGQPAPSGEAATQ